MEDFSDKDEKPGLRRIHGLLSVCSQRFGYTATQYALLSSTYAWLGKILKGFSGAEVESLSHTHGLIHAYGIFFIACGLTGVPAVLLFAALDYWHRRKQPVAAMSVPSNL